MRRQFLQERIKGQEASLLFCCRQVKVDNPLIRCRIFISPLPDQMGQYQFCQITMRVNEGHRGSLFEKGKEKLR
jgi:hypothetical protein